MNSRRLRIPAFIAGMLIAQAVQAAAGTIILSTGEVFVRNAGGVQRNAPTGTAVDSGEAVITQNGRAQIRFTDDGMVSLQPRSEFQIVDYRLQDTPGGAEQAVFGLVRGALRALTGEITARRKGAYRLETNLASVGIRGTEFTALLCEAASCEEPDGLYVHTGEGTIFVRNAFGEIDVARGQTAYVAAANVAPQRTSTTPAVSARASTGTSPTAIPGVSKQSELQVGAILSTSTQDLGPLTTLSSVGLAVAVSGSITFEGETYSGVGSAAGAESNLLGIRASDRPNATGVVGVYLSGNVLRGLTLNATDTSTGESAFATITVGEVQNGGSDGGLYWGRWTGTTITASAGLNTMLERRSVEIPAGTSLHYVLGTSVPTIPTAGSATYDFVGGTPSTDLAGGVGQGITAGSLTANFLANRVNANMTVVHSGTYSVTAVMPFNGNRASFTSDNPGGSASASGAGQYAAMVNGFFAGTNSPTAPSRAGISYTIHAPSPIVGVGAFACRPPGC